MCMQFEFLRGQGSSYYVLMVKDYNKRKLGEPKCLYMDMRIQAVESFLFTCCYAFLFLNDG
jgi:hypothetical protein